MKYYENGLPEKPLYMAELSGFKNDTAFIPFSNEELTNEYIISQIKKNKGNLIVVVDITPDQHKHLLETYGKIELLSYIVSPDFTEFWLIFKDYYIVSKGLTKSFQKEMKNGRLSCVLSCGPTPILLPFSFQKPK